MAKKKPVAKKATAKKATKKPAAKKATAKKPAKKTTAAKTSLAKLSATTRRPDANLPPTVAAINVMTEDILDLIGYLDNYAANLRSLDRMRHNGVGIKRLGFIEAALRLSTKFPQYFPHWLTTQKFQADLDLFNAIRSLVEVCRSLEEKAWNINIEASDMAHSKAPRQAVWMKKISTAWRTTNANTMNNGAKASACQASCVCLLPNVSNCY